MKLEVVHLPAEARGPRVRLPPFDEHNGFDESWWGRAVSYDYDWLSIRLNGTEVARARIITQSRTGGRHGVLVPPQGWTEIDRIEVIGRRRGSGLGRDAVHAISDEYPRTKLAALSLGADGFWSSLGWTAYDERAGGPTPSTLFISN